MMKRRERSSMIIKNRNALKQKNLEGKITLDPQVLSTSYEKK